MGKCTFQYIFIPISGCAGKGLHAKMALNSSVFHQVFKIIINILVAWWRRN